MLDPKPQPQPQPVPQPTYGEKRDEAKVNLDRKMQEEREKHPERFR